MSVVCVSMKNFYIKFLTWSIDAAVYKCIEYEYEYEF